jgi:hypothetical protein
MYRSRISERRVVVSAQNHGNVDKARKAREYATTIAVEIVKQLITLSSAFIVVTASVLNLFVGDANSTSKALGGVIERPDLALISWGLAILSIVFGILALGAISATAHDNLEFDVDEQTTRRMMMLQQISFTLMFVLFVAFASVNLYD